MKKRVLALVMSTAMIASVLTACGGKNDAPAQTQTQTQTMTHRQQIQQTMMHRRQTQQAMMQQQTRPMLIMAQARSQSGLRRMFRHSHRIRSRLSRRQILSMLAIQ